MIKIIQGSVLDAQEQYVLQQCDCISTQAKDLDSEYKNEFPWANVYGLREPMNGFRHIAKNEFRGKPGEIKVFPSGTDEPSIVAMFSQICPGRPFTGLNKSKKFKDDTVENRAKWFAQCFDELTKLNPESVAMPYEFGCYKNGADWEKYSDTIQEFNDRNPDCWTFIYIPAIK